MATRELNLILEGVDDRGHVLVGIYVERSDGKVIGRTYRVRRMLCDEGRLFHLYRGAELLTGESTDPHYNVCLEGDVVTDSQGEILSVNDTCDCPDNTFRGNMRTCKHIEACRFVEEQLGQWNHQP